jgi:signal transduction histidine kinase
MFDFAYLDHIAFPIFVLQIGDDDIPRYVAVNTQARHTSGRPLSDYLGRSGLDVYPDTHGNIVHARHCEAVKSGQKLTYQLEMPSNGRTRIIRTTLSPVCDDEGAVRLLFGSTQDVSAEHNAAVAQESFERLSSEMNQFVAIAAHDLRAPMRNVALLADMLRESVVHQHEEKQDIIDVLEDVAQTSLMLITEVLRTAQNTATPEKPSTFDLKELCADLTSVLDLAGAHTVQAADVIVHADRCLIQIALRNMLENAIKHAGQAHVEIDVTVQQSDTETIKLSIRDNGVGFSQSALAFLDGGRFQIDSGYGLFGVKRLVGTRGGDICTRNRTSRAGALVEITLPGKLVDHASLQMIAPSLCVPRMSAM